VEVLVYGWVDPDSHEQDARIRTRCVDCDAVLDRFGADVTITEKPIAELVAAGYTDLDRGRPVGPGGCFENNGCDGCPKIETRPW
tara:strand:- start:134 stop:388 length:255 start_codon:yes stop_codon:yes gene_type:complete